MRSSLFISLQHSRTLCRHTTLRPQIKQAFKFTLKRKFTEAHIYSNVKQDR